MHVPSKVGVDPKQGRLGITPGRAAMSCLAYQPCATATMTDDKLLPFDLPAVRRKKLTVDFEGGYQSSNGGALLLRESERDVGVCRRLAGAMPDRRDPDHIQHQMVEMVTARVTAIACGHEDAIDHNDLRHDPLMKVAVGRCPESGAPLGSQSTISRLENAPSKTDAARLTVALVDQFGTTVTPGRMEMFDIDDTFCVAHGGQQLAFWNAHHDERGFAPMHIYHAGSGAPVVAILRPARTSCGAATAITAASRRWTGRTSTTTSTTSSASPAMRHSMRWWPRPPTICASITPRAARRSCAPMRASPTRPAVGHGRAKWWRGSNVRCSLTPEEPLQTACARRSTSATSSPRSKARRSICMRTSTASADRWKT